MRPVKYLLVLLMLFPSVALAGQVKIYLDETRKDFVMADKMDCRVHKTKNGITLGLKGGNFLFSFGPEITLGGEARIKWEKAVQGLVVRYEELCSRFNTGVLTRAGYERRLDLINELSKEAFDFQEGTLKMAREHAKEAFNDLDKETGRKVRSVEVEKKIDSISSRVDAMAPLDREGL